MAYNNEVNIGFDINANSIKVAAVKSTKTGLSLLSVKEYRLTPNSVENSTSYNVDNLIIKIKKIIEEDKYLTKRVAVALKDNSAFVRKLSVCSETVPDLKETFPWILDQYVSIDPEDTSFDFKILGEDECCNHVNVLVAGAKKDVVTNLKSIMESAGADLKVIEPESLSLVRLFLAIDPLHTYTSVIINVDYTSTEVILLSGKTIDYSQKIDFSGKYCTDIVMSELNLSQEESEVAMIHPDLHSTFKGVRTVIADKFCIPFVKAVDSVIKRYTYNGGSMPHKIILSGEACEICGLGDILNSHFFIPVEYLDPCKAINMPDILRSSLASSAKYAYNVAIGLAMRENDC